MEFRKIIFIIVSVYLISLICGVFSFNIDTKFPIVYKNPGEDNNTFGYSVILYEGNSETSPWIQIGAPKFKYNKSVETGHVYRCGIKQSCNLLNMKIELNVETSVGSSLGHSMDISPDGSIFATCGHRYIERSTETADYYSKGFCHWGNTNENTTQQKIPLKDEKNFFERKNPKSLIYAYGNGQAGFSLQFANIHNNTDSTHIVVGVPGAMNWAGTFLLWLEQAGVGAARRRRRSTSFSNSKYEPFRTNPIGDLSLSGYSVTSGYFYEKDRLDYAFGAPRVGMIGSVNLVNYINNENIIFEKYHSFDGVQYGEYYGGALAAADLNGDGYSELIVGAPTFKANKYNEGKIYIYKGGKTLSSGSENRIFIEGKDVGAQFGDSIASLGDIDFDGFNDIAVAATYADNGIGSVYIYRGSKEGLVVSNPQIIKGKDIGLNVLGFGRSIARPRDIDGNGYNDLAIGAYKSEQAFIFRAKPVITLKLPQVVKSVTIDYGMTAFNLTFSVEYETKRPLEDPKLTLIPTLVIDPTYGRAIVEAPEKIQLLGPGMPITQTYNIKIVKDDPQNIDKEMDYTLSYKLEERTINPEMIVIEKEGISGNDAFCRSCPVFDPKSKQDVTGSVSFNLGCGTDNKCYPILHVNSLFEEISKNGDNIFTIGSKSYIKLVTEVSNTGDKAYQTKLSVKLPSKPKVTLRKLPATCKLVDTEVTCTIANPLEGDKKTVELELDMSHINEGTTENLLFNVSVSTIGVNNGIKFKEVQLLAMKSAKIEISGRSKEEYYTFDNTSSTVEFTQVLQIQKEGPSALENVLIDVEVPVSYGTDYFIEMYQPTLKEHPITCDNTVAFIEKKSLSNADSSTTRSKRRRRNTVEDVTQKFKHFTEFYINCSDDGQVEKGLKCEKLQCSTGRVNRDVIEILFKYRLHIGSISRDILGESDVIIYSTNFGAKIDDKALESTHLHKSLSSVLVGPNVEKMVPIWIIIVAVLCGVLVLAIIAAVLYKFGFFKRKNKEKLKEMADNAANDATTRLAATDEE
nr:integrin alpha-PS4-like isoform X1 [Onthophagus taurus]